MYVGVIVGVEGHRQGHAAAEQVCVVFEGRGEMQLSYAIG